MKPIVTKYSRLSDVQQKSIDTLIDWLYTLYSENDIKDYYQIWNWLKEIKSEKQFLNSNKLGTLRELWDTYAEFKTKLNKE